MLLPAPERFITLSTELELLLQDDSPVLAALVDDLTCSSELTLPLSLFGWLAFRCCGAGAVVEEVAKGICTGG
jgi:hypothetical protein